MSQDQLTDLQPSDAPSQDNGYSTTAMQQTDKLTKRLTKYFTEVTGLVENEPLAGQDVAKKPLKCPHCSFTATSKPGFISHVKTHYTAPTSVNKEKDNE